MSRRSSRTSAPSPTSRRSPSQARSRNTVEVLLEATRQCLQKEGVDGLNTTSVANRAGVSIGTLYQYFPNKEALIAGLVESIGQREEALVTGVLENTDGLENALGAIIREYFKVVAANRKLFVPLIHALYTICRREDIHRLERAGIRRFRRLLERYQPNTPHLDRTAFIASYTYIGLLRFAAMVEPKYLSDPAFVEDVVSMVIRHTCPTPEKVTGTFSKC